MLFIGSKSDEDTIRLRPSIFQVSHNSSNKGLISKQKQLKSIEKSAKYLLLLFSVHSLSLCESEIQTSFSFAQYFLKIKTTRAYFEMHYEHRRKRYMPEN